jgi:hypothetical protein
VQNLKEQARHVTERQRFMEIHTHEAEDVKKEQQKSLFNLLTNDPS